MTPSQRKYAPAAVVLAGHSPAPAANLTLQNTGTINIGNRVWEDVNQNGVQDEGEPGTKGVTLLLGRSDASPIPAPHFPFKTTNDNGEHSFTGTSAVLVFGNGFADAVTAGPLAAAANGPLLLTASRDLEPQVLALLKEKGIKRVFVVGVSKSVPEAKATALRTTRIEVVIVAGSSRY